MPSKAACTFSRPPVLFTYALLSIAAVYLGLIGILNHANYNTNASDYAYYLHQLHQLSQFKVPWYTLGNTHYTATWGDHFEPSLILLVPFKYLFGTYTLAVMQIVVILLGALGIRRLASRMGGHALLPDLAMAHFLFLWGVQAAVSFDFHMNVLGTMAIPWLLEAFSQRRWAVFGLLWILFLGCSETFGFWGMLIGGGLAWMARSDRKAVSIGVAAGLIAISYQYMVLHFVIPLYLQPGAKYVHFRFSAFGKDLPEALLTMIQHPWDTFTSLFSNHTHKQNGNYLKGEFYLVAILGGAWATVARPVFLWMTLPLVMVKMLSDKVGAWGLSYHYGIVFAPFLSLALYGFLSRVQKQRLQIGLGGLFAVIALASTLLTVPWRCYQQEQRSDADLFDPTHWKQDHFDIRSFEEAAAMIPGDANLSASGPFAPHLAMRDTIRMFPFVPQDTEYLLILRQGDTWPANEKTLDDELCKRFLQHVWWDIIYDVPPILVLQNRVASRKRGRDLLPPNTERNPKPL